MKIDPNEREVRGEWRPVGGRFEADDNCHRIDTLRRDYLVDLDRDSSGWEILYRDPNNGSYWELTYPQSEMQGGGPPLLSRLEPATAQAKYGSKVR